MSRVMLLRSNQKSVDIAGEQISKEIVPSVVNTRNVDELSKDESSTFVNMGLRDVREIVEGGNPISPTIARKVTNQEISVKKQPG